MQGGKARALVLVPPWGALHNAPEHREDPKSKRALSHSVENDKQARRGAHDSLVTHQRQSLHPSQKSLSGRLLAEIMSLPFLQACEVRAHVSSQPKKDGLRGATMKSKEPPYLPFLTHSGHRRLEIDAVSIDGVTSMATALLG